ncbi:restriction endonuclease subunit S [Flavobacterium sp. P4023]|uniref:Restriction endonuclease subunit S n=1 Tax=Flavobacterium flabelliforme TaxID=2816119 RepID=A0ABS5CUP3_9FLAO|nr:restriction endonuclease subunit S [Flavobacterium flabelliforme]MBP4142320.1 restriction endonuclease subunit S [Flavobacterium flabelliforme]
MEKSLPQLRFPGFEGEWEENMLGNLIKIKSGNSPSSFNLLKEGNYPFIKVEELNNCIKYQNLSRFYCNESKNLVEKNSVIFPKRGAAILNNKVRINDCEILMDSNMMAITPIKDKINHEFLFYKIIKEELYKIADTSTIPQINNKHIEPYRITFPDIIEQTKIATFLTEVDKKLTALKQKKTLLEQYKKGVMQQIFSQQLRFKDDNGNDFPDWEEKKLGEIAKFSKGKNISKSDISDDGIYECIRYGQLYTHYKETINNIISKTNLPAKKLVFSKYNDIIIPASGETQLDIATASCVLKDGVALGGDLNIIKTDSNGVYLSYYLNYYKKQDIANLAQGISVVHLYAKQLSILQLSIPILKEQTKIANFLSAIDEKINHCQGQIEKMQVWKKGLLQQLFV